MSTSASKRIETAANVSIILVALLGSVVLVKRYLLNTPVQSGQAVQSSVTKPEPGAKIALPDVDWAKNGHTLLIVLSKGCHFCEESAPFYKQIVIEAANRKDLRVIAVFPQGIDDARQYLAEIEVPIKEVRQFSPSFIGVKGTPTLLLVDRAGVIEDVWLGRLKPDMESEVLQKVACQGCG